MSAKNVSCPSLYVTFMAKSDNFVIDIYFHFVVFSISILNCLVNETIVVISLILVEINWEENMN